MVERSAIVHIRNAKLTPPEELAPGGTEAVLNERETDVLHWGEKLTLEFNGPVPGVSAISIERVDVPTVTDQPDELAAGWGQMIPRFFKPEVAVANHAESGETMKSFITSLRLTKVLQGMKAGDYLFIQFAHNDQKGW